MQNTNHSSSLETTLASTKDKMYKLLRVLENETVVFKNNNIEELEVINQEKITLTEEIEENEQQRIHFLTTNSLDPNKPAQWLKTNKLQSLWKDIKQLSEKAQRQNQINGMVINGNRRRIQTQIEILCTSSPTINLIYSASGENVKQRNSTTLAHV